VIAVDTSAIVAIALKEPEAVVFAAMIRARDCLIGRPTVFEAHLVMSRLARGQGVSLLDAILAAPRLKVLDFGRVLFKEARSAFDRYGRGRHPARLNFGDCMAYAVAKAHDVPLLYKGRDFAGTDIAAAFP
jgi:ribonuclease VapC